MEPQEILADVQRQIFENNGMRTDVYYTEGKGAIVVPEFAPLNFFNIIIKIPAYVINSGGKINVQFGG